MTQTAQPDTTARPTAEDLLARVLEPVPQPFALLHRPGAEGARDIEVLLGDVAAFDRLSDLPLPDESAGPGQHLLALLPHRQIAERGFDCVDDGTPLLALAVTAQATVGRDELLSRLPNDAIALRGERFEPDDDAYAETVRTIIGDEIGSGAGSNFVIRRSFEATIEDYSPRAALAFFRRLLDQEEGSYWCFLVWTGDRAFVGATPEQHVKLRDGIATMNPISGTYRYGAGGPELDEVIAFLGDRKETDELYMVVDEELKMMSRICDAGASVRGPFLKEMTHLAHTEYVIEGRTETDPREILRETMFAPTVTGSPLESACRVIARHEPAGRGYYGGVAALFGRDGAGTPMMDSALLIRTADIDSAGGLRIGVGATLVRHSDPHGEVEETRAKAAGLITALTAGTEPPLSEHPRVRAALEQRNRDIADFWLTGRDRQSRPTADLAGRHVLVVDGEDTFTSMLEHQLRSLGVEVTVQGYHEPHDLDPYDLVVMGPGPGDPRDDDHPKIASMSATLGVLLRERRPFVAICLSHQLLSRQLGLDLHRRDEPNQGVQREIDLFGNKNRVGFYNTFVALSPADHVSAGGAGEVEVSRDEDTHEVHALRGPYFASMQFHPESVLTADGVRIVSDVMRGVLDL